MSQKFKKICSILIPIFALILSLLFSPNNYFSTIGKQVLAFIVVFFSFVYCVYYNKLPIFISKFLIVSIYIISFGLGIYAFLLKYDLLKYFTSITAIKELILATGTRGTIVFLIIQIAQVVFLPIPAVALLVVGVVIYGSIKTMLLCSLGVLIGSYISFMVGKTFGYKFISWFIGEEKVNKYANLLKKNGRYILSLVFIFPFFPDDLFCMVAGISSMSFKEFFIIATTIRPITIIILCIFGGGALFSLNSFTGIIFVVAFAIACLILTIILFKKNKKVRAMFKC